MKINLSREPLELRVAQKGLFKFGDTDGKTRDIDDVTDAELNKLCYNDMAMNTLMNDLCPAKCEKISSCVFAERICDTLESCH